VNNNNPAFIKSLVKRFGNKLVIALLATSPPIKLMSAPTNINPANYFVYVLVPHLEAADSTIDYYYDFSQSIEEFTNAFKQLGVQWKWQPASMQDYKSVIDDISVDAELRDVIVFNLCDGDEVNGSPGISIIRYLHEKGLMYTGSDDAFYDITTSKIIMKEAFDAEGVAHAPWFLIVTPTFTLNGEFHALKKPVIVKPAISAGSIGVGVKNVVHTEDELQDLVKDLYKDYHGWKLAAGGFVAEAFIIGREFTTFIIGSPGNEKIYPPVERVFHKDLPELERFLSFDRLWEFYEGEKPIGDYEDFYNYYPVEAALAKQVEQLSLDAYRAVGGTGYGRIDLRQDEQTGKLYVLEVNAQCGLSEDENYTSIGAILRYAGEPYYKMLSHIIKDAVGRYSKVIHDNFN
jgi:D-alanine-D-alanine ligase